MEHPFYQELSQGYLAQKYSAQQKAARWSWVRVLLFLLLVGLGYWGVSEGAWAAVLAGALGGSYLFAFVVLRHQKAGRKARFAAKALQLCQEEQRWLANQWGGSQASKTAPKDHPYAADLDIEGPFSLLSFLDRSLSPEGRQTLKAWLLHPASPQTAAQRQKLSEALSQQPKNLLELRARVLSRMRNSQEEPRFRQWLQTDYSGLPGWLGHTLNGLASINLLGLALMALGLIPYQALLLWLGVVALALSKYFGLALRTKRESGLPQRRAQGMRLLARYIGELEGQEPLLASLRQEMAKAQKALRQMSHRLDRLDASNNALFGLVANVLFYWDIRETLALKRWQAHNAEKAADWLDRMAEFEAHLALATLRFNRPEWALPQIEAERTGFELEKAFHPLMQPETAVANSLSLGQAGTCLLITGSNMSGKSTFERTVGLCLVLAQAGAVVPAAGMRCGPTRVFTSMRTVDDLEESLSSFYAELKRLRHLLAEAQKTDEAPLFYAIDEVLKGTNSQDRHRGAAALIRQLVGQNAFGMVSTHDLDLVGLAEEMPEQVFNYSFNSRVEGGELIFEYQLREGPCRSFNADFLMRQMGIVRE